MSDSTFAHQESLPKLPIPDLKDTCENYLEALRPLQTPHEHERTERAVHEFLNTSGPILQEELKQYGKPRSSYIEQFWYDSYLNYDSPLVLNLNPFFLIEDDPTPVQQSQVERAATLTTSSLRFIRALRREELPADDVRGTKLCMYQYSRLFASARIPSANGCVMQSDSTSKHIVVLCRSQFYWFDVLDDNNDLIMVEKDIALNFDTIIQDAEGTPITEIAKGAVGVLTTENRRVWASIRDQMNRATDSDNYECLKLIDSALFVVCLDHAAPESLSDLTRNALCGLSELQKGVQVGTCTNRWYDKLQIIVTQNAKAGVTFEHTGVDGHTVLRFVSDIYTDSILRFANTISGAAPSLWKTVSPDPAKRDPASFGNVSTTPRKLEWSIGPELQTALRFAETRNSDLIHQNEFECLSFNHYGKRAICEMGCSPDAFVQMVFQAAYYVLYGRVECTYEPAMTKTFLHGRTESIRSVTKESSEFCRKFCEDLPAETKLEYLRKACQQHTKNTKKSSMGLGQDRHLYALLCIWRRYLEEADDNDSTTSQTSIGSQTAVDIGDEMTPITGLGDVHLPKAGGSIPAIFSDPGWDKLNNTILSTSNCGNPALKLFGFGPTSPDGYGLGYIIKEDSITICASSKHRQTARFLETLSTVMMEIRLLFREVAKAKAQRPAGTSRARSCERVPQVRTTKQVHFGRTLPRSRKPSETEIYDEEMSYLLGGYGYFDMADFENAADTERLGRKEIGRKLRLAEY